MIEPINHIRITPSPSRFPAAQSNPAERNDSNVKRDISESSSKYILDGKKIIFERYDRNGKMISRVQWTAHRVTEKA